MSINIMKLIVVVVVLLSLNVFVSGAMLKTMFGTLHPGSTQPLTDIDAYTTTKHIIIHRFGCFDQRSDYSWYNWVIGEMLDSWNRGRVTHFSMDPFDCATGYTNVDSGTQVISGLYDVSIAQFVSKIKVFLSGPDGIINTADDRRLYMRWAHELNGNWYPWSVNKTSFILSWRYMWQKFNTAGLNNRVVSWVWEPVAPYAPDAAHNFYLYYPGDAYVDWLSLDGYNWARVHSYGQAWYQPAEVFDDMLFNLRDLNASKPIMISEVGCATMGSTVAAKSQWILDWYAYAVSMNIAMIVNFNTDADGADWTVFGGKNGTANYTGTTGVNYKVYAAYKTVAQQYSYTLSTTSNPRLFTDSEWVGALPGYNVRPTPRPKILFDDALKNDWKLATIGCPFDPAYTSIVNNGTKSLKIDFSAPNWNGIQLAHSQMGVNSSHYNSIVFYFNPGIMSAANYKNLDWQIYDQTGTVLANVYFSLTNTITASKWNKVTIPLSAVGIPTGKMLLGFYIRYMGNTNQGNVYLDDIQLLPNNFTWPVGWPVGWPTK